MLLLSLFPSLDLSCCFPPLFSSCPFRFHSESDDTYSDRHSQRQKRLQQGRHPKFIEQAYSHLPSTRLALLTQHLNLLKSSGPFVMVKKSFKLPKFDASPKRGRPPKHKPNADTQPQPQPDVRQNANPVCFALGLEDEPTKTLATRRGPGRPPKATMNIVDQPGPSARRGRPPGSKRPERSREPKPESEFSDGTKRRPGRPPKNQTNITAITFVPPYPDVPANITAITSSGPAVPPDTSLPSISSRGRGRPKKNAAAVPPSGAAPRAVGAPEVRRPKDPARRSVGRPKKGTSVEDELRSKLEYFQLKVNESLRVIKPHFNISSPVSAIAAIQELERLATMDLNASGSR